MNMTDVVTVGAQGYRAPSPTARQGVQVGRVFVDFGRGKVYALADDGEDILTFKSLEDMVERLRPALIVVDSLPNKHQSTAVELAKTG